MISGELLAGVAVAGAATGNVDGRLLMAVHCSCLDPVSSCNGLGRHDQPTMQVPHFEPRSLRLPKVEYLRVPRFCGSLVLEGRKRGPKLDVAREQNKHGSKSG